MDEEKKPLLDKDKGLKAWFKNYWKNRNEAAAIGKAAREAYAKTVEDEKAERKLAEANKKAREQNEKGEKNKEQKGAGGAVEKPQRSMVETAAIAGCATALLFSPVGPAAAPFILAGALVYAAIKYGPRIVNSMGEWNDNRAAMKSEQVKRQKEKRLQQEKERAAADVTLEKKGGPAADTKPDQANSKAQGTEPQPGKGGAPAAGDPYKGFKAGSQNSPQAPSPTPAKQQPINKGPDSSSMA